MINSAVGQQAKLLRESSLVETLFTNDQSSGAASATCLPDQPGLRSIRTSCRVCQSDRLSGIEDMKANKGKPRGKCTEEVRNPPWYIGLL